VPPFVKVVYACGRERGERDPINGIGYRRGNWRRVKVGLQRHVLRHGREGPAPRSGDATDPPTHTDTTSAVPRIVTWVQDGVIPVNDGRRLEDLPTF
jgi:hypothetical protein